MSSVETATLNEVTAASLEDSARLFEQMAALGFEVRSPVPETQLRTGAALADAARRAAPRIARSADALSDRAKELLTLLGYTTVKIDLLEEAERVHRGAHKLLDVAEDSDLAVSAAAVTDDYRVAMNSAEWTASLIRSWILWYGPLDRVFDTIRSGKPPRRAGSAHQARRISQAQDRFMLSLRLIDEAALLERERMSIMLQATGASPQNPHRLIGAA